MFYCNAQRHILELRKSHAETLKKIHDLKHQLYILRLEAKKQIF